MAALIPKAGWFERTLALLGRRRIILVEGDSMYPALKGGEKVLVDLRARISVGDVVLANHPFKSSVLLIKRVTGISAEGRCFLSGDNPIESSDSRSFGALSAQSILGRVTSKL